MTTKRSIFVPAVTTAALAVLSQTAVGAEAAPAARAQKTAFAPSSSVSRSGPMTRDKSFYTAAGTEANPLVFSAPPRGPKEDEIATYQPIADMLTAATGKKFVYRYSDNWLNYSKEMVKGSYDLVFDGPAFNGWRINHLEHTPLVKLPEDFVFVIVTGANSAHIKEVRHLAGRKVCAHSPPNLGTLTLLSQFDNPARQPTIMTIKGWQRAYEGLVAGECEGTILPVQILGKVDKEGRKTRVLYKHRAMPNNAFSAGPRISADMQNNIRSALLSEQGRSATARLRSKYAGKDFVLATRDEYASLGALLKDSIYYY